MGDRAPRAAMRATQLRLHRPEARWLRQLARDLSTLVDVDDDPVLDRLAPSPYPDDAEASAEFRTHTRDDLLDRRRNDADVVVTDIDDADPDGGEHVVVVIHELRLDAWLRTLTAIRLIMNERGRTGPAYDRIGYRLDQLVESIDPEP
ncbi:MAG: DUF2017 family protein [Microbacterium sp.]